MQEIKTTNRQTRNVIFLQRIWQSQVKVFKRVGIANHNVNTFSTHVS